MTDWVQLLIATATALLGALGLAYWSYRAQTDRSALVGSPPQTRDALGEDTGPAPPPEQRAEAV